MTQKILTYVPVAILVLLVLVIGYWAVNLSLTLKMTQAQTNQNSKDIQTIGGFLQNLKVGPQTSQTNK